MSFPRVPIDVVEYGFQVPEAERWQVGEGLVSDSEEAARAFVAAHPGCTVVRRRVVVGAWEPVDE